MGLTFRDIASNWLDGEGVKDRSTKETLSFLNHVAAPGEKYKYIYIPMAHRNLDWPLKNLALLMTPLNLETSGRMQWPRGRMALFLMA